jgi:hypothetical protein
LINSDSTIISVPLIDVPLIFGQQPVKIKTQDSKLKIKEIPYATFKIIFQRIFEYTPYYVLGGQTIDTVQINFAKDDIDYLISVLERVKVHLEKTEEGLTK